MAGRAYAERRVRPRAPDSRAILYRGLSIPLPLFSLTSGAPLNVLIRNMPERTHKALPVIASCYGMKSVTDVILWAVDAMVLTVEENDPVVRDAILRASEGAKLPERVEVGA
jgi:hypothetical protein